jgi:hypothetical protein
MNNDILLKIEEYAGYFLSFKEIASLVDIDADIFTDTDSDEYKAYFKGKTLAKLEIRKNIVKLAKHGSPQAEQLADKYISDQELSEFE